MLNRLTNTFSSTLPASAAMAGAAPSVYPWQGILEVRRQLPPLTWGQHFNQVFPSVIFDAPFLQLMQALEDTSLPVTLPIVGLLDVPYSPAATDWGATWGELPKILGNWWLDVRRDLTHGFWSTISEPVQTTTPPPPWPLPQISNVPAPVLPLAAPAPSTLPSPAGLSLNPQPYPEVLPSAIASSLPIPSSPLVSPEQIASSLPIPSSPLVSPEQIVSSLPIPSSFSINFGSGVERQLISSNGGQSIPQSTTQSTTTNYADSVVQRITHPTASLPDVSGSQTQVPQLTPPASPSQPEAVESSSPTNVHLHGGIHVQIAAQKIDREHAQETARAIAGHVLKEMNRITERDRLRRGLPPSR